MHLLVIQRILGLLLVLFSVTMVLPMLLSWYFDDGATWPFASAFLIILCSGLLLWLPVRHHQRELRLRDGFLVVVLFWSVLGAAGALPFMIANDPHMPFADSLFESIAGLTTTGATVIVGIDDLPISILFYRQWLQWLGGMGIIVLAVAVLPMLGVGGMQLYRAETPGPMKDNKLTPRITETAKQLWYIYLGLTIACTLAYWLAGMTPFDAIAHAFSTVAIGGFSTHDASMGFFQSNLIDMVAVLFMLVSGTNFALHFVALHRLSLRPYAADAEFRMYVGLLAAVALICSLYLYATSTFANIESAFYRGVFQAVSIGTTTGFTTAEYYRWPGFLEILLLLASFVGACAGSTGGGMKVIRFLLLIKQGMREIMHLIHPAAQIPVRIGGKSLSQEIVDAVWGFFALYVASFTVMYLLLAASGLDLMTSFSAVAACINNLGPGLAGVGSHYGDINDFSKYVLCFAMLLGRLEVFTLLVIITPAFWRT